MVAAVYDTMLDVFCQKCNTWYTLSFNEDDMFAFLSGEAVQNALPYLSSGERELLLSNICGSCFDKMFPPLDNDE